MAQNHDDEDEEDDYMKMTFAEEPSRLLPRGQRNEIEKAERGKAKPKVDEQAVARDKGLAKNLIESEEASKDSKALRMMKMMGYEKGQGLGKGDRGHMEPIRLEIPKDRTGVGHASERKRKLEEAAAESAKRYESQNDDYRGQIRSAHEEKRIEGQLRASQRACEQLHEKQRLKDIEANGGNVKDLTDEPLSSIDITWRGRVRDRLRRQAERRFRQEMMDRPEQSLSQSEEPGIVEAKGLGDSSRDEAIEKVVQEDLSDEELDSFETMDIQSQLQMVLDYMRSKYAYCFWCGCQYDNVQDLRENCPGLLEDDH